MTIEKSVTVIPTAGKPLCSRVTARGFLVSWFYMSLSLLGFLACHSKDPQLIGIPPKEVLTATGSGLQVFSPKVDILFVIDDSGSMAAHQTNLLKNMNLFLDKFDQNQFIDYHMGIITTSESLDDSGRGGGRLVGNPRFIDKNTPQRLDVIRTSMKVGTSGSPTEKMFSPTKLALSDPNLSDWNKDFLRPEAYLAYMILSDAEDSSDKEESGTPRAPNHPLNLSPADFFQFLLSLKEGDSNRVLVYSAFIPTEVPNTVCPHDDGEGDTHYRLEEFLNLSHALTYTLCDPDFGAKLSNVGTDLVRRVGKKIQMKRRPQLDSIQVRYGTQLILSDPEKGWRYDPTENAISFGDHVQWSPQAPGTNIEVHFQPEDSAI